MTAFKTIRARAAKRKGGEAALAALLPEIARPEGPGQAGDDRVLAGMTKRIFSAGFVWSMIEQKWPGFEAAFLAFQPPRLLGQPDEFWEALTGDKRIVRNPQKIMAVRSNAASSPTSPASMAASAGSWPSGRPTTRSVCSICWPSAARASAATPDSTSCASSAGTAS